MVRYLFSNQLQNLLFSSFILGTVLTGCLAIHEPFLELELGMPKEEVRGLLGNPSTTDARKMPDNENREVWRYFKYSQDGYHNGYLSLTVVEHSIVFSNDHVAGWDIPNPFSSVLISKKTNE